MAQATYRRSGQGTTRKRGLGFRAVAADVRAAFIEHNLLTYAAAMAFQMIVALLPLAFLSLALLGAFGLGHLWEDSLAQGLRGQVTPEVFRAIDATGAKIVSRSTCSSRRPSSSSASNSTRRCVS